MQKDLKQKLETMVTENDEMVAVLREDYVDQKLSAILRCV